MEQYQPVFLKETDQRILPGSCFSFDFEYTVEDKKAYRLFFTGEVDNFYFWKSEYCSTAVYKRIDESLVPGTVGPWGLQLVGSDYPVIAARKQTWPPVLGYLTLSGQTDIWTYGIYAKADNFRLLEGGYLRLRIEIRNKKENSFAKHTKDPADRILTMDIPEGTYDLTEFTQTVSLPQDEIANLMFIVEGEKFEGTVTFEAPALTSSNGYNIMPPFGPDSAQYAHLFNWFGVNLSKAEWPAIWITEFLLWLRESTARAAFCFSTPCFILQIQRSRICASITLMRGVGLFVKCCGSSPKCRQMYSFSSEF